MTIPCSHEKTRERYTVGFCGAVSVWPQTDSNPAAHGNITVSVECVRCGARRSENINGHHIEVSPWRGSRAEREATIRAAREALAKMRRPDRITLTRGRETAHVWVDAAGDLVSDADDSVMQALPEDFLLAAQAYRRAVVAVADAEAERD